MSWEVVEDFLGVLKDMMELEDVVADEDEEGEEEAWEEVLGSTCEMVDPSGPW